MNAISNTFVPLHVEGYYNSQRCKDVEYHQTHAHTDTHIAILTHNNMIMSLTVLLLSMPICMYNMLPRRCHTHSSRNVIDSIMIL